MSNVIDLRPYLAKNKLTEVRREYQDAMFDLFAYYRINFAPNDERIISLIHDYETYIDCENIDTLKEETRLAKMQLANEPNKLLDKSKNSI